MGESPLQASVIIATYNRGRVLPHVLGVLDRQTVPPDRYEIVIADDGSTDDTPQVVAREAARIRPHVTYLRLEHCGAAAARNAAIRASRGQYLVFIDSDIICSPQFLEEHLRAHERWKNAVVTGPAVLIRSLDEIPRRPRIWDWSAAPFAGGNASVRRQDAFRVGLFDESFDELGWEDIEFGIRLKQGGLVTCFVPTAVGYHYKPDPIDPAGVAAYASSQGRMAVRLVRKHPILEARMATGLNPLAMAIDRLASVFDWDLRLARWILRKTEGQGHFWLRSVAAKQLYNRLYYKAARAALRQPDRPARAAESEVRPEST
ncbi:MAG: glycosyltransferase [Bacillota bacterium]